MLDEINTYSHPDVTPAQVLLKRNNTLSSQDITYPRVLRKRNNSLSSSLERLSNGRLSSSSFSNSNIINGKDQRIIPTPRKFVIRKSILMGRPSAINAATSAVRPRSLWSKATEATTQGRIPCPPTPPDSLAPSSGSDKTTTRELPPREQKQHKHKHKQQEHTLAWHPLPILVGTEQHSTDQNKANTITTPALALKQKMQTSSVPPPPLRTRFILPPSSSKTFDLAKQTIDWQSPFHSFISMVICLTILSNFNQAENNNNSLFYFIIMNAFKMTGLSLLTIFLCENIIKCKILTTDLIQWPMFQYWINNKLYPFVVTHDPYFSLTCAAVIETCNLMMAASQLICLIIYLGPKLFMELQHIKKNADRKVKKYNKEGIKERV